MKNQHCKVGSSTPITSGSQASTRMISYYQRFMNMASDSRYAGTQLGDFFERKAHAFKKRLDQLA
ncbi:hypothetical protein SAMN06265375_102345 [Muriicola jejuensis]|uniref:Uncharacterized protein n=1 Tax=Muriicola jejuensis TaxID=504488 RepID=A0A6P0UCA9_9FLAO|nr:hypothetical protein [Muriicola jejuensis]NER10677.1 hypothetical protein [Muriicola jejuensis]SMP17058.1 hypothetical protein SAMN06265375_102345 [Muriicola jejuensis]